jgi:hypothetical protein
MQYDVDKRLEHLLYHTHVLALIRLVDKLLDIVSVVDGHRHPCILYLLHLLGTLHKEHTNVLGVLDEILLQGLQLSLDFSSLGVVRGLVHQLDGLS